MQFAEREFSTSYVATVGVDFKVVYCVRGAGTYIKLQVWDTAGQERYQAMSRSYYRGADGMLLVYAQDDRASFTFLHSILAELERDDQGTGGIELKGNGSNGTSSNGSGGESKFSAPRRKRMFLVANKSDLGDEKRAVPVDEALALAKRYGMRFCETSAKLGVGVEHPFLGCADDVMNGAGPEPDDPAVLQLNGPGKPTPKASKCPCSS